MALSGVVIAGVLEQRRTQIHDLVVGGCRRLDGAHTQIEMHRAGHELVR